MPKADLAATVRLADHLEKRIAALESKMRQLRRVAKDAQRQDIRADVAAVWLIQELAEDD